jgi:hypothetical protein
MSLYGLKLKILELDRNEQLELSEFLVELLNPALEEFDRYWLEVVKTRIENVKTGKSKTIPLQEVIEELERRI